ncbi:MAG: hypothetical protein V2A74_02115 [bacterium]
MKNRFEELEEKLERLIERLEQKGGRCQSLEKENGTLRAQLQELQDQLKQGSTRERKVRDRLGSILNRLEKVEQ